MSPSSSASSRVSSPAPAPPADLAFLAWAGATIALFGGGALLVWNPELVLEPWSHPRVVALVHLFTHGWLLGSSLAAIALFGSGVFGLRRLPRLPVAVAIGLWAVGTLLFAAGSWWGSGALRAGGACVLAALFLLSGPPLAWVAIRSLGSPAELRWGLALAMGNLALASLAGLLVALPGSSSWVPGGHSGLLAAHAVLALAGWSGGLVTGAGVRMLPMLRATPPPLRGLTRAALAGFGLGAPLVAGCFLHGSFLLGRAWIALPALAALALVASHAIASRQPKRPAAHLRQPDAARSLSSLALALFAVSGLAHLGWMAANSLFEPVFLPAPWPIAIWLCGLGTLVLAVWTRFLPYLAWQSARERAGTVPPLGPEAVSSFGLRWLAAGGWGLTIFAAAVAAGWPSTAAQRLLGAGLMLTAAGILFLYLRARRTLSCSLSSPNWTPSNRS